MNEMPTEQMRLESVFKGIKVICESLWSKFDDREFHAVLGHTQQMQRGRNPSSLTLGCSFDLKWQTWVQMSFRPSGKGPLFSTVYWC